MTVYCAHNRQMYRDHLADIHSWNPLLDPLAVSAHVYKTTLNNLAFIS